MLALSKNQRVLIFTTSTVLLRIVLITVSYTFLTSSTSKYEAISAVGATFSIIHQTANESI